MAGMAVAGCPCGSGRRRIPPHEGARQPREDVRGVSFGSGVGLVVLMGYVRRDIAMARRSGIARAAYGEPDNGNAEPEATQRRRPGRPKKENAGGTGAPKNKYVRKKRSFTASDVQSTDGEFESELGGTATAAKSERFSPTRTLFTSSMSANEKDLRFLFLESLMDNARSGNVDGVEEVMSDMDIVGLKPGPRSYHGLIAAYARANDVEGALHALRREVASGETPLQETFVALGRLLGRAGLRSRGEQILAAMESANLDPRNAWMVIVEELFKSGYLNEANKLFLTGANGGFKATDQLYDILVEENCKCANHGVAIDILRAMEARGRLAATFHYNCLLLAQGNAGFPDIAADTFETMQYERPDTWPDTESYNLMIQAQTRHDSGERVEEVIDLLGEMIDDNKRVKPNARTYALLVECFVKFNYMNEALRHFRALTKVFPGSLHILHCDGNHGDPLSLLLRSLCLEGRIVQLVEVLDLMIQEGLRITPRAMWMNRKGRTLVSSWVEPLQQEADIGCEVDFVARYIAEGGSDGTRRRWVPSARKKPNAVLPDHEGYRFWPPAERSYKQFCVDKRREYKRNLVILLEYEGVFALGENATQDEYNAILERLKKETYRKKFNEQRKPKAASKLSVGEMKEELEAQGLPTDGARSVLYQRVQKARRINLAKGQPLWMPPEEDKVEEQIDEAFEATLSKIDLRNPRQQYRKKCFIEGVGLENCYKDNPHMGETADTDEDGNDETDTDLEEDVAREEKEEDLLDAVDGGEGEDVAEPSEASVVKATDDEEEEEEEEEEVVESPVALEQLLRLEGRYVKTTLEEKRAELAASGFDFSELEDVEEVWGWTWERELQAQAPEFWSRKHEVELGILVMQKVVELGGTPTIGDCAMHVQNALKIPWPTAVVTLIRQTHKIGHKFGGKLYEDAVTSCLSVEEKDAAIAILTDMEAMGISSSNDLLGRVLPDS